MNPADPDQEPQKPYRRIEEWERDPQPHQRAPVKTNPALSVLRIVLWLLPSIVVPVAIYCVAFLARAIGLYMQDEFIIFIACITAVAAIGYFDQRILLVQKQLEYAKEKDRLIGRIVIFIVCQIFIIPILWFTLIYGFCIVTGSGYL